MKRTLDEWLGRALTPTQEPDAELVQGILEQAKETKHMEKRRFRIPAAAAAACVVLAAGSVSTAALYHYLNPIEVAQEIDDQGLIQAFQGKDAVLVNQSQEFGDYRITFLGYAPSKEIRSCAEEMSIDENEINGSSIAVYGDAGEDQAQDDILCAVTAIERIDGKPMPANEDLDPDKDAFFVSFFVHGLDPNRYNAASMGGGYAQFVKDGVLYRAMDMDNIEMFADQGIFLGVNDGTFYNQEAYQYDEKSGDMARREDYTGVNALFSVPVDASKADPAAAMAYLKEWDKQMNSGAEEDADLGTEADEDDVWMDEAEKKIEDGTFTEIASPIKSTVRTLTPEKADKELGTGAYFEWKQDDGSGGTTWVNVDELFKDKKPGDMAFLGWQGDGTVEGLNIEVAVLNADGTVTCAVYTPNEK